MIIGLCGYKNSGKDAVAAYLIKTYDFERKAFADPLKHSVAALLNIPMQDVDKFKNDPEMYVDLRPNNPGYFSESRLSFREFLQRYGTEAHRDVFGKGFWLDATLPIKSYVGKSIVVTDVRFQNEADRIKELGGLLVQVYKPTIDVNDDHPSETEHLKFKFDHTITNRGTMTLLFDKIEMMMGDIALNHV